MQPAELFCPSLYTLLNVSGGDADADDDDAEVDVDVDVGDAAPIGELDARPVGDNAGGGDDDDDDVDVDVDVDDADDDSEPGVPVASMASEPSLPPLPAWAAALLPLEQRRIVPAWRGEASTTLFAELEAHASTLSSVSHDVV